MFGSGSAFVNSELNLNTNVRTENEEE